jgi:hypothetical protein
MTAVLYSLDIVSATFGPKDVTELARQLYVTNTATSQNNVWTFTPSNANFGPDPFQGTRKFSHVLGEFSKMGEE